MAPRSYTSPYKLDPEWAPNTEIVEDSTVPAGHIVTRCPQVRVAKLSDLFGSNPPGSVTFIGKMKHEQLHGLHQMAYQGNAGDGPDAYNRAMAMDPGGFQWDEERQCWALELEYDAAHGEPQDPTTVAAFLADGYTSYGLPMISQETALAWVKAENAKGSR